jgi:tetratricopeptide (TPR) repeat protein
MRLCTLTLLVVAMASRAPAQSPAVDAPPLRSSCTPAKPDPETQPLAGEVAEALLTGKPDQPFAEIQKQASAHPRNAIYAELLGELQYSRAEMQPAAESFTRALKLDPCNARARYFAWRLDALAGRTDESFRQLDFAHRLAPADISVQHSWTAIRQARVLNAGADAPIVRRDDPSAGFFLKSIDCDGIPIRSSAAVDNMALILACGKVRRMLADIPVVRRTLVNGRAGLDIIGDREKTTDLPQNREFQGKAYQDAQGNTTDMDKRTRGVGGLTGSCGEENILGLPSDRYYRGEDICIHEFAHEIMDFGFSAAVQQEIEQQYRASLDAGLWKGAYAAVNSHEFFAELSAWYFGTHGQFVEKSFPAPGREGLRGYDPQAFNLIERLYTFGR